MTDPIHALIQTHLQQHNVVSLVQDSAMRLSPDRFVKAGLLPFMRAGGLRYCVMKPVAKQPDLPPPEWQICKGTRMHYIEGIGWRDMKEGTPSEDRRERLVETALREGMEELGLELANIVGLFDMGPYNFASATSGKGKHMWVFAVEVIDAYDFLPLEKIADTTADRSWLLADEFAKTGRADHGIILQAIDATLHNRFK